MVALAGDDFETHDVALHGAWPTVQSPKPGPTLIERTDEDFVAALLADLKQPDPQATVDGSRPEPSSGDEALRLFQPVHRVFNLVLLETHCETFGSPRLDPKKIESSGLVVRRVVVHHEHRRKHIRGGPTSHEGVLADRTVYEGWLADRSRVTGWTELTDQDADPDPARRPQSSLTGDHSFDETFRGGPPTVAEASTSLFVAAPDVAAATGRTVLYGVVPLTSASRAGAVPQGAELSREAWEQHLSLLLQSSPAERDLWPGAIGWHNPPKLQRSDLTDFPIRAEPLDSPGSPPTNVGATRFVLLVRQLAQEFGLLGSADPDTGNPLVKAMNQRSIRLIAELDKLPIWLVDGNPTPAGTYLHAAASFYFVDTANAVSSLLRPQTWPPISDETATALYTLLRQIAGEIAATVVIPPNQGGRYDDASSRYAVRAFLRLKCPRGCPPRIIWSEYSEPFRIAPWFEQGPAPPVPIQLPDIADLLKTARPGVSFGVPRALAKVLNQDPKNFLQGKPGPGTDLGLDWICGFNIPIITICAFIVLNIFLNLLNILFWWLPFVKICIPFPRKK